MKNIFVLVALLSLGALQHAYAQTYKLLVGAYTGPGKGNGINSFLFDQASGIGIATNKVAETDNPSFLALSPNKRVVYAVNESGEKSGISAFKLDAASAELTLINAVQMISKDPCYIIADEKYVITANYSSGDIAVFPVRADGGIGNMAQLVKHTGSGKDPKRQASAHAHMVLFTPDGKHLLATDLGADRIYIYSYDKHAAEPLKLKKSIATVPGAGPRHLDFSKDNKLVYVLGELDGKIHVYSFENNDLKFKRSVAMIFPVKTVEKYDAADIHVSPDGRFLYASLRGDENTISVFDLADAANPKFVERTSTSGSGPRNFTISPDGKWLLVAHQRSHSVIIFERNTATGKLSATGNFLRLGAPVALLLVE